MLGNRSRPHFSPPLWRLHLRASPPHIPSVFPPSAEIRPSPKLSIHNYVFSSCPFIPLPISFPFSTHFPSLIYNTLHCSLNGKVFVHETFLHHPSSKLYYWAAVKKHYFSVHLHKLTQTNSSQWMMQIIFRLL